MQITVPRIVSWHVYQLIKQGSECHFSPYQLASQDMGHIMVVRLTVLHHCRMAHTWPSCCLRKATRSMASSGVRQLLTQEGFVTCMRTPRYMHDFTLLEIFTSKYMNIYVIYFMCYYQLIIVHMHTEPNFQLKTIVLFIFLPGIIPSLSYDISKLLHH